MPTGPASPPKRRRVTKSSLCVVNLLSQVGKSRLNQRRFSSCTLELASLSRKTSLAFAKFRHALIHLALTTSNLCHSRFYASRLTLHLSASRIERSTLLRRRSSGIARSCFAAGCRLLPRFCLVHAAFCFRSLPPGLRSSLPGGSLSLLDFVHFPLTSCDICLASVELLTLALKLSLPGCILCLSSLKHALLGRQIALAHLET